MDVEAGVEDAGPSVAGPPAGGALSVTKAEWEQIEAVPPHTRRVGLLFQKAAQEMGGGAPPPPQRRAFDAALFAAVRDGGGVRAPGKPLKKADQIRAKTLAEVLKADRLRAQAVEDLRSERAPPRLEAYGGRFESYSYALLLWLRALPPVAAAVAAEKALRFYRERVEAAPPELLGEFAEMARGRGGDPREALSAICESEELLSAAAPLDAELALHPEQAEFVSVVRAACAASAPLLLRYQTPPSGGKTSASALLGAALMAEKQQRRHVIYACFSRPVRVDVCKHLVAASVPFAIVVGGVASPSYTCFHGKSVKPSSPPPLETEKRADWSLKLCARCDRFPVVLVCDLLSTVCILRHRGTDVLLFDEPTAHLSEALRAQVRDVLRSCPAITVLMSATVPAFEEVPRFVERFLARHPGAALRTVRTERLPMSVTALDAAGRVRAPHDFGVPLEAVEASGHLRRFYSPAVLRRLAPADLSFADLLSYEAVRAACFRCLRAGQAAPADAAASGSADAELQLRLFCCEQAALLPGASLVVMDSPEDFVAGALAPLLASVPSLRRLSARNSELSRTRTWPVNAKEREELLRSGFGEAEPERLQWPADCVVNHREHLARFHGSAQRLPVKWQRAQLPLPQSVADTTQTCLVEAALCGVLQLGSAFGDAAFEAAAQTLAEQARESFVVSGLHLIYGINLPVERVVVACRPLSHSDMMQLCGRAGRTGRSAKPEVVFLSEAALRAAMVPGATGVADASLFELACGGAAPAS